MPVRSTLVGAIAGVIGVVACLTFRAGIDDAIANPQRSGIVWNFVVAQADQPVAAKAIAEIGRDRDVLGILARDLGARRIDRRRLDPDIRHDLRQGGPDTGRPLGPRPRGTGEIALAPTTMKALGLHVGERVKVGSPPGRSVRVVGRALLPPSSHTDYDQSAWMTAAGLQRVAIGGERHRRGGDRGLRPRALPAGQRSSRAQIGGCGRSPPGTATRSPSSAELPSAVADLGKLRTLPFALAVFFALLASATVAHHDRHDGPAAEARSPR